MRFRKIAAVSTLALAASGLMATTPANAAATKTINYKCQVPVLGQLQMSASQSFKTAVTAKGKKLTVAVTVPADLSKLLGTTGKLKGKINGTVKVGGKTVKYTAKIPATGVPATGDMVVTGKAKVKLPKKGKIKVGGYNAALVAVVDLGQGPSEVPAEATCKGGGKVKIG